MIHLITQRAAISDCIPWVQANDQIVLTGTAAALKVDKLELPAKVTIAVFEAESESAQNMEAYLITIDEWIEWLEKSPCRTWS
jgi:hypothetical protein